VLVKNFSVGARRVLVLPSLRCAGSYATTITDVCHVDIFFSGEYRSPFDAGTKSFFRPADGLQDHPQTEIANHHHGLHRDRFR
jgi:hypothetical protein